MSRKIVYFGLFSDNDRNLSIHKISFTVLLKKSNFTVILLPSQFSVHRFLINFTMGVNPVYAYTLLYVYVNPNWPCTSSSYQNYLISWVQYCSIEITHRQAELHHISYQQQPYHIMHVRERSICSSHSHASWFDHQFRHKKN